MTVQDQDDIPDYGTRKRSVTVQGRKTSIALTDSLWQELKDIAARDGVSVNHLISCIRGRDKGSLARAIRLHIVNQRASDGHGCQ